MSSNRYNPASHALQAVGQAIVSSLNPAGSTVAQLNAVKNWVAENQISTDPITLINAIAKDGPLAGNPVAEALERNYKLTTGDISAFFARYNVQDIVDQDGTGGTLNTGLQVIRAFDTQTNMENLFVAGADPTSEFIPVGTRETSYFGGAITQGKALVNLLEAWKSEGIDLSGATFVSNSLGASTLAMALPNTTVAPGEIISFGGYGLDKNGLENGLAGAYPGVLLPIGFTNKAEVTSFLKNVAASRNVASATPTLNFVNGADWVPLFNDLQFGTLVYLYPTQVDVKDWRPSFLDGLVQHAVGAYYRSLVLEQNNTATPIVAPTTYRDPNDYTWMVTDLGNGSLLRQTAPTNLAGEPMTVVRGSKIYTQLDVPDGNGGFIRMSVGTAGNQTTQWSGAPGTSDLMKKTETTFATATQPEVTRLTEKINGVEGYAEVISLDVAGNRVVFSKQTNIDGDEIITGIQSVNGEPPLATSIGAVNAFLADAKFTVDGLLDNPGNFTNLVEGVDTTNTNGGTRPVTYNGTPWYQDSTIATNLNDFSKLLAAFKSGNPLSIASAGFGAASHQIG